MQSSHTESTSPGLANLMTDLQSRFLAPSGISLDLDKQLRQARYSLKHKKQYLETQTLFEPINRLRFLPLDNHHSTTSLTLQQADLQRQASFALDRVLSTLETSRLPLSSQDQSRNKENPSTRNSRDRAHAEALYDNGDVTVMSLLAKRDALDDKEELDRPVGQKHRDIHSFALDYLQPHLSDLASFGPTMTAAISNSIEKQRQEIISFVQNTSSSRLSSTAATVTSLDHVISQTRAQCLELDKLKDLSEGYDLEIRSSAKELFDTLHRSVIVLWEVVTEFMIKYQFEQEQKVFKDYFAQMVQSVILKLSVLKATLQESVYDSERVAQLTQVRYQSAGKEFNMIVDAYADVMQQIEIVQDDIRRMV
ncbi:hypothetical protein EDD11_010541 [Mortierella claussenii]|nr:hypothetical protein EDD11_010541 [Mortierella claussenii]